MNSTLNLWLRTLVEVFKRFPQIFICVGASIILAVLIYSRVQVLTKLNVEQEKINHQLDIVMKNQAQGAELGVQLQELKRLTAGMPGRLMAVDDKAANSQFFYDLESRSRATLVDLRQTMNGQGDGMIRTKLEEFTAVGFTVTVSGRVGYVMSFLKRLEGGKFFARCNSLTLRGSPTVAVDGMEAVLKIEVLAKK